jgi:protein-disulfide isomerase
VKNTKWSFVHWNAIPIRHPPLSIWHYNNLVKINNAPNQLAEENSIMFNRINFCGILALLTIAAGLFLGYLIWGPEANRKVQAAAIDTPPEKPKVVRYDIPVDDSPFIGPPDAPIVIVEFSDYQCPFCQKWHEEVYGKLFAAYPGQIKFVYRNLPLTSIHLESFPAAEAALCAGDQNAYWQFHDRLFTGKTLDRKVYLQYAEELDLDMVSFEKCITDRKHKEVVQDDSDFAIGLGIRSTPTFFINGIAVIGAQPLDTFKQVINQELAEEFPHN